MRLSQKEKPFQVMPAATDEQIEEHFGSIHKVDKAVEMSSATKAKLLEQDELQKWRKNRCRS